MALELARMLADRLGRPRQEVEEIAIAIMRADAWPRDHAGQMALLMLVVMFGATRATAAGIAANVRQLFDDDGRGAVAFVAAMLTGLADLTAREGFPAGFAYRSTIYAECGDGLAVRVRFGCEDGAEEIAFTADPQGYRPDRDISVSLSLGLPGRLLFRIARDLAAETRAAEAA